MRETWRCGLRCLSGFGVLALWPLGRRCVFDLENNTLNIVFGRGWGAWEI